MAAHVMEAQRELQVPMAAEDEVTEDASDRQVPLERVEAELCTLAGQIAAATSRFLRLLGEFDAREGWAGWNVRSCAHWLSWRCGMDLRTAREQVRVARALRSLPQITEAFDQGRVSYSKVRAMARVATPESEQDLLNAALHAPAAHLERLTRGMRLAKDLHGDEVVGVLPRDTPTERHRVQWSWEEDGSVRIWGHLSPEDGARLLAACTRANALARGEDGSAEPSTGREAGSAEPSTGGEAGSSRGKREIKLWAGHPARAGEPAVDSTLVVQAPSDLAPALLVLADLGRTEIQAPIHAPAAEVIVHVDQRTLAAAHREQEESTGSTGEKAESRQSRSRPATSESVADLPAAELPAAHLDDGPALDSATICRLACDGRIRLSVDGRDGRTLDLGRQRRRPTTRQLKALWQRDRGCAVPGCGRTRFLHAHHVIGWAVGGPTNMDNLILLCGEHHRALHEGEFGIVALGKQKFRFHRRMGARWSPAPRMWGDPDAVAERHPDVGPDHLQADWDGTPVTNETVHAYLLDWAIKTQNSQHRAVRN
jgi:hypothetical protein